MVLLEPRFLLGSSRAAEGDAGAGLFVLKQCTARPGKGRAAPQQATTSQQKLKQHNLEPAAAGR